VDMVKFGISAYKQAAPIEGTIDQALEQMKQKQAQAMQQPQQPNPEIIAAQAEQEREQMKMQIDQQREQMKMQADQEREQMKMLADQQREQAKVEADLQIEQIKSQNEAALEKQKQDFEAWRVQYEGQNEINVARIKANPGVDVPLLEAQELQSKQLVEQLSMSVNDAINRMAQLHEGMMQMQMQTMQQIEGVKMAATAPKRVIRGADGKVIGVEVVQ